MNEYAPVYEPTFQDFVRAGEWLTNRFGAGRITAEDIASLSWLIAEMRHKGKPTALASNPTEGSTE